eukprot:16441483-Heterocapsa_arctica.AAC.1
MLSPRPDLGGTRGGMPGTGGASFMGVSGVAIATSTQHTPRWRETQVAYRGRRDNTWRVMACTRRERERAA